jgi:hypothetical protein
MKQHKLNNGMSEFKVSEVTVILTAAIKICCEGVVSYKLPPRVLELLKSSISRKTVFVADSTSAK